MSSDGGEKAGKTVKSALLSIRDTLNASFDQLSLPRLRLSTAGPKNAASGDAGGPLGENIEITTRSELLHAYGTVNVEVARRKLKSDIDYIRSTIQQYLAWCSTEDDLSVSRFSSFCKDKVQVQDRLLEVDEAVRKCARTVNQRTEQALLSSREPRDAATAVVRNIQALAAAADYQCYVEETDLALSHGQELESPLQLSSPQRSTPRRDEAQLASITLCSKSFVVDVSVGAVGHVQSVKLTYSTSDGNTLSDEATDKHLTNIVRSGRYGELEAVLKALSEFEGMDVAYPDSLLRHSLDQLEKDLDEVTERETQSLIFDGLEAGAVQVEQVRRGHGVLRKLSTGLGVAVTYYLPIADVLSLSSAGVREPSQVDGYAVEISLEQGAVPVRLAITKQLVADPALRPPSSCPASADTVTGSGATRSAHEEDIPIGILPYAAFGHGHSGMGTRSRSEPTPLAASGPGTTADADGSGVSGDTECDTRPSAPVHFILGLKPPVELTVAACLTVIDRTYPAGGPPPTPCVPVLPSLAPSLHARLSALLGPAGAVAGDPTAARQGGASAADPSPADPVPAKASRPAIAKLRSEGAAAAEASRDGKRRWKEREPEAEVVVLGQQYVYVDESLSCKSNAGQRVIVVERLPMTHPSQLLPILNTLRQHLVFDDLYRSCFPAHGTALASAPWRTRLRTGGRTTDEADADCVEAMAVHRRRPSQDMSASVSVQVVAHCPDSVQLVLLNPASHNLMLMHITIAPGGGVAVALTMAHGDVRPCSDAYATALVTATRSLPLCVAYVVARCSALLSDGSGSAL